MAKRKRAAKKPEAAKPPIHVQKCIEGERMIVFNVSIPAVHNLVKATVAEGKLRLLSVIWSLTGGEAMLTFGDGSPLYHLCQGSGSHDFRDWAGIPHPETSETPLVALSAAGNPVRGTITLIFRKD